MSRPPLSKILVLGTWNDHMRAALAESVPDVPGVYVENDEDRRREIVDATAVIGGKLTEEELEAARDLTWHHVPWVGVESLAVDTYKTRGITLTNGSGVNSANIAEHVVAMVLAFARDLPSLLHDQAAGKWRPWEEHKPVFFELGGQRVLLVGTGAIGQEVAKRLSAFGCEIVGASRSGREVPGIERVVDFDHLNDELAKADHVISSLPMTPLTAGIMNAERIGHMKQGAYFYNVGRGGTVDQEALIAALDRGDLAGAGLDVVEPEPLPEGHPLWSMPNVIMTAHTSGNSPKAQERMATLTAEQLRRYQAGEELLNIVDMEFGY